MKTFCSWFRCFAVKSTIFTFAFLLCISSKTALADTYQIFGLGDGYFRVIQGIEASGAVIVADTRDNIGPCHVAGQLCYETWVDCVLTSWSTIAPIAVYDNGTICHPPADPMFSGDLLPGVCNNGHEIYGTDILTPRPYHSTIFDGPDPIADQVFTGDIDRVYLNSSGDFALTSDEGLFGLDRDGLLFQAIDLTTRAIPEPGSMILLGTGVLGLVGTVRRRLFR